jgi:hypothetical protein
MKFVTCQPIRRVFTFGTPVVGVASEAIGGTAGRLECRNHSQQHNRNSDGNFLKAAPRLAVQNCRCLCSLTTLEMECSRLCVN